MIELHRSSALGPDPEDLRVVITRVGESLHTVQLSGELDLATCAATVRTCSSPVHQHLLIDLSGLTFMDCAGYGALVRTRSLLERRGGSATLINPGGEPRSLLGLIAQLEGLGDTSQKDGTNVSPDAARPSRALTQMSTATTTRSDSCRRA